MGCQAQLPHQEDVPASVTDALKNAHAVFHLAAMADVNDIVADPAESVALNTLGVARVLEAGRRADAGRVIVSSTVWVYAATHGDVVDETTPFDLETDRHLYVSEKIAAEMFCRDYATLFGRPYTVLRYGIPFGPRMRSDLVVAAHRGVIRDRNGAILATTVELRSLYALPSRIPGGCAAGEIW